MILISPYETLYIYYYHDFYCRGIESEAQSSARLKSWQVT